MKTLQKIIVDAPSKRYAVYCGKGALRELGPVVRGIAGTAGVFVLTSPNVARRWERPVLSALRLARGAKPILFDDREAAKNLATVEKVCRELIRAGADRHSTLVAVGGGVVGDVVGFVAASYLRGVKLIHVPTTLVAQVDSAVGGKTGVNLAEGKNLVGAFYQPDAVIVDPATLKTLPEREYRSGIYEVIKYGIISDSKLFRVCERELEGILDRDPAALNVIIPRCVRAKARVTALDEREAGLRETLNFGHTFAHALESVTNYCVFRHGEAVAWGIIAATLLGIAAANLPLHDAARIIRLVRRVGPLPALPKVSAAGLLAAMRSDKKSQGGRLRFVLPTKIGTVRTGVKLPEPLVSLVWNTLVQTGRSLQ
jgi:3-dehydroquinate synthase